MAIKIGGPAKKLQNNLKNWGIYNLNSVIISRVLWISISKQVSIPVWWIYSICLHRPYRCLITLIWFVNKCTILNTFNLMIWPHILLLALQCGTIVGKNIITTTKIRNNYCAIQSLNFFNFSLLPLVKLSLLILFESFFCVSSLLLFWWLSL